MTHMPPTCLCQVETHLPQKVHLLLFLGVHRLPRATFPGPVDPNSESGAQCGGWHALWPRWMERHET